MKINVIELTNTQSMQEIQLLESQRLFEELVNEVRNFSATTSTIFEGEAGEAVRNKLENFFDIIFSKQRVVVDDMIRRTNKINSKSIHLFGENGYVDLNEINELKLISNKVFNQVADTFDEINKYSSNINDIILLEKLDTNEFSHRAQRHLKNCEDVINQLSDFEFEANNAISKTKFEIDELVNYLGVNNGTVTSNMLINFSDHKLSEYKIRKSFYDNLPDEIKNVVNLDDIIATDDGFAMLTKPMSEIMVELGITGLEFSSEGKGFDDVNKFMDDWFLYGVHRNGKMEYSFLKIREEENDSFSVADSDATSFSLSFIPIDMNKFVKSDKSTMVDMFYKSIGVGKIEKNSHSKVLSGYFANTRSKGSYMVSDFLIDEIITRNDSNSFTSSKLKELANRKVELEKTLSILKKTPLLPGEKNGPISNRQSALNELNQINRVFDAYDSINKEAGYKVYNSKTNEIVIKNQTNPTDIERRALLLLTTGNVNKNSFAAEIQFHARACESSNKDIPVVGDKWYNSAFKSDNALGEERESGNFDKYYDLNSDSVKEQEKFHGKQ